MLLCTFTLPAAQSLPRRPTANRPWSQSGRPAILRPGGSQPAAAAPPARGGVLWSQASSAAWAGPVAAGGCRSFCNVGQPVCCVVQTCLSHTLCSNHCTLCCTLLCCDVTCCPPPCLLGCSLDGPRGIILQECCEGRDLHSALQLQATGGSGRVFGWYRRGRWMSQKRSTTCTAWCVAGVWCWDVHVRGAGLRC